MGTEDAMIGHGNGHHSAVSCRQRYREDRQHCYFSLPALAGTVDPFFGIRTGYFNVRDVLELRSGFGEHLYLAP